MSLAPGIRIGAYEVVALIGAGGMGEVYCARDMRLNRDVAIKILPDTFAADAQRVARFQREAQVLASLNHSNIGQIYGLEQVDTHQALVLELVDGPTLANRIAEGPIPINDALPIAKQIAEALEAAHDQGIIHRDLKPANIKLTPDGKVKVLDFGLAKALEKDPASQPSLSDSPTITSPALMTGGGVILGTAAYMSPEQARGRSVDTRTDIWAFGCVLYEMLTGHRAFDGDDVSITLAAVLMKEPDWTRLPARTPRRIRELLGRCLEKESHRRVRHIGIIGWELDQPQEMPAGGEDLIQRPKVRLAWTAVAAFLVGSIIPATAFLMRGPQAQGGSTTRLEVVTAPTTEPFSFAISPDGRQLAYVANGPNGSQLWLRSLDKVTSQPLAGTTGATYPFWSPDNRAIGFFAESKLKRMNLSGGAPEILADAPGARGGTWSRDGVIVFGLLSNASGSGRLMRVPAGGGAATTLTTVAQKTTGPRWPQFLPDGKRVLYYIAGPNHGVFLVSLADGSSTRIMETDGEVAYVKPGYLLRVSQGTLLAHPFDPKSATVTGQAVTLDTGIGYDGGTSRSAFSASDGGVIAHRGGVESKRQFLWIGRDGKILGPADEADASGRANPALSATGNRIAFQRTLRENIDVWTFDARRAVSSRLTFSDTPDGAPIWSPDESQIIFRAAQGNSDLLRKPANGSTEEYPVLVSEGSKSPLDWSSDGRMLLYSTPDAAGASDLWILPLQADRKPEPIVQSRFDEIEGQFSPDGRWLAYASNESGRYEIYVQPTLRTGAKWQISSAGGLQPRWRRDGRELFYVADDRRLMAVAIHPSPSSIVPDVPLPLFQTRLATGGNIASFGYLARAQYDVAPDGRFLMNVAADESPTSTITILLNWPAELNK
jgi:serine/threonine protein kinase